MTEPLPPPVPIEDQRKRALEHYKEASNAVNHISIFVVESIKAYKAENIERAAIKKMISAMIQQLKILESKL